MYCLIFSALRVVLIATLVVLAVFEVKRAHAACPQQSSLDVLAVALGDIDHHRDRRRHVLRARNHARGHARAVRAMAPGTYSEGGARGTRSEGGVTKRAAGANQRRRAATVAGGDGGRPRRRAATVANVSGGGWRAAAYALNLFADALPLVFHHADDGSVRVELGDVTCRLARLREDHDRLRTHIARRLNR